MILDIVDSATCLFFSVPCFSLYWKLLCSRHLTSENRTNEKICQTYQSMKFHFKCFTELMQVGKGVFATYLQPAALVNEKKVNVPF